MAQTGQFVRGDQTKRRAKGDPSTHVVRSPLDFARSDPEHVEASRHDAGRRLRKQDHKTISTIAGFMNDNGLGQSQLTVGKKTWLCKLPKLPPILVPPPEAQIRPATNADP